MPPSTKPATTAAAAGRTPKAKSKIVVLKVTESIRALVDAKFPPALAAIVKEEATPPTTTLQQASTTASPAPNASASSESTPVPNGTNDAIAMPPPSEPLVKKGKGGGKRKAETTIDGVPKPRGKPGPKKRKL